MSAEIRMEDLPTYVLDQVNQVAVKEGFSEYTMEASRGSNHGDGFMSILVRVHISGKKNGQPGNLNLLVKMPPREGSVHERFSSLAIFVREILMYDQVLPQFAAFQRSKGVVDDVNGFLAYPKCYATLMDEQNGHYLIIMEDLRATEHKMFNKFKEMDINHIRLVVEELAKFHAISFSFRKQKSEEFKRLEEAKEVFLDELVAGSELTKKFIDFTFAYAIKSLDPADERAIQVMTDLKENFAERMKDCVGVGVAGATSVFTHGDVWNNNLQFKYGTGNTPSKVVLIDWQLSRIGSPALDLAYFLFSSTSKSLRNEHYLDILRHYYDKLSSQIELFGNDPKEFFTYEDLRRHMVKFGKFALLTAPMLMQVITADPLKIPDFEELAKELENVGDLDFEKLQLFVTPETHVAYQTRINDVIKDVIELGYC